MLNAPTPARCQRCHGTEVAQFDQSRHGLPAYVAMVGKEGLTTEQLAQYDAIPEAASGPPDVRNALYTMEGPDITPFACEACHGVGAPRGDGSVGVWMQGPDYTHWHGAYELLHSTTELQDEAKKLEAASGQQ